MSRHPKPCKCGNIARHGETQCGKCLEIEAEVDQEERAATEAEERIVKLEDHIAQLIMDGYGMRQRLKSLEAKT